MIQVCKGVQIKCPDKIKVLFNSTTSFEIQGQTEQTKPDPQLCFVTLGQKGGSTVPVLHP